MECADSTHLQVLGDNAARQQMPLDKESLSAKNC